MGKKAKRRRWYAANQNAYTRTHTETWIVATTLNRMCKASEKEKGTKKPSYSEEYGRQYKISFGHEHNHNHMHKAFAWKMSRKCSCRCECSTHTNALDEEVLPAYGRVCVDEIAFCHDSDVHSYWHKRKHIHAYIRKAPIILHLKYCDCVGISACGSRFCHIRVQNNL